MTRSLSPERCVRLGLGAMIFVAGMACATLRRDAVQPPATLIFTNASMGQATVYLVGPTRDLTRLGTLLAGRTDTFTVAAPMAMRGSLNIVARLLGSPERPQTGPIMIYPGVEYQVRLPVSGKLMSFGPSGP